MLIDGLVPFDLKKFKIQSLKINSQFLKSNPLGDSNLRYQNLLVPKELNISTPVVFMLSGFASDGYKNFSFNRFETNTVQQIDQWTSEGLIQPALYVFVNAWTKWGGSQFINSEGAGLYEDYIIQEIVPEVMNHFECSKESSNWYLFGGSSGGYGALHLGTKYPDLFSNIIALAPDSFFESSLLPEVYKYLPYIKEIGGVEAFKKNYEQGLIKWPGDIFFGVMNLIAMASCYAPIKNFSTNPIANEFSNSQIKYQFPINDLGFIESEIWSRWLQHDPIYFLPERKNQIKELKSINLFTGNKDEHALQYGSRQIESILKSMSANIKYTELNGTHRSLSQFFKQALKYL